MRKLLFSLLITSISAIANAQVLHPVKWAYGAKIVSTDEAVIFIKATIEDSWHIYSAYQKPEGPLKTTVEFNPVNGYELLGNVSEPAPLSRFEKAFNMNVTYFEHEVIFQQKIRLIESPAFISGTVSFMCCNDQKCLAPETVNFNIPIK